MRLLEESIAFVSGLDGIIVSGTWCQLDVSEGAFDVETEADSVKPTWFDCFIILIVGQRPGSDEGLLHFLLPQGELLGLAL